MNTNQLVVHIDSRFWRTPAGFARRSGDCGEMRRKKVHVDSPTPDDRTPSNFHNTTPRSFTAKLRELLRLCHDVMASRSCRVDKHREPLLAEERAKEKSEEFFSDAPSLLTFVLPLSFLPCRREYHDSAGHEGTPRRLAHIPASSTKEHHQPVTRPALAQALSQFGVLQGTSLRGGVSIETLALTQPPLQPTARYRTVDELWQRDISSQPLPFFLSLFQTHRTCSLAEALVTSHRHSRYPKYPSNPPTQSPCTSPSSSSASVLSPSLLQAGLLRPPCGRRQHLPSL
jgi:hypothetical protein